MKEKLLIVPAVTYWMKLLKVLFNICLPLYASEHFLILRPISVDGIIRYILNKQQCYNMATTLSHALMCEDSLDSFVING